MSEEEVPRYPHARVVKCPNNKIMVTLSWGKKREVGIVGDRITCVLGKRANCYAMYLGEENVGWWETPESEMETVN